MNYHIMTLFPDMVLDGRIPALSGGQWTRAFCLLRP